MNIKKFGVNVHDRRLLRMTVAFLFILSNITNVLDGAGYFDDGTIDDFDDIENEYDEPKSSKKARLADKKKRMF